MDDTTVSTARRPLVLGPGDGRDHPMGRLDAGFAADGAGRAGMLNVSVPGDFEAAMPGIARWFVERPAADADC